MSAADAWHSAREHFGRGRSTEVEALFQQTLRSEPNHAGVAGDGCRPILREILNPATGKCGGGGAG